MFFWPPRSVLCYGKPSANHRVRVDANFQRTEGTSGMLQRRTKELGGVAGVAALLALLAWAVLDHGRFYGPWVLLMTIVPVGAALLARLDLPGLIPDLIFGAVDTGLLTFAALLGGTAFGVVGAIVGGVVGDAITDGIAGFFEGGIAEWLRSKGINESRTALGSACGKMAGCLAGSGLVLTAAGVLGVPVLVQ
jgi:hypothetical protein